MRNQFFVSNHGGRSQEFLLSEYCYPLNESMNNRWIFEQVLKD